MTNNLKKFIIYSLILHTVVIFGLSIKWYAKRAYSSQAIDVTIVHNRTKEKPTDADYIAQVDNIGGGTSDTKNEPSNKFKPLFEDTEFKEITKEIKDPNTPDMTVNKIDPQNNTLTSKHISDAKSQSNPIINNSTIVKTQDRQADFIIQPDEHAELASLVTKIEERANLIAKNTKRKIVSASTQQSQDAAYLIGWREKIEFYGNKYYPVQAKERNLSGQVIVSVSVRSDGTLEKVSIEKSSGIKILDEAAIQTVHIAAPFEPFPQNMSKDTEVLEIIRTWRFNQDKITTG